MKSNFHFLCRFVWINDFSKSQLFNNCLLFKINHSTYSNNLFNLNFHYFLYEISFFSFYDFHYDDFKCWIVNEFDINLGNYFSYFVLVEWKNKLSLNPNFPYINRTSPFFFPSLPFRLDFNFTVDWTHSLSW